MRKLLRSIARANMEAAGIGHINKKLYNPTQRKGESDEAYKARCARSKAKSLFALNWRNFATGRPAKRAEKKRRKDGKEKAGLARFFQNLFNRQYVREAQS